MSEPALSREPTASDRTHAVYLPPWRIDVVIRAGVALPISVSNLARAVTNALHAANAPTPASVTVVLTDDAELAELNLAHMGHEGPTDVLSFPMLEPESFLRTDLDGAAPPARPGIARLGARPRTHVGDIAISIERATEQAVEGRGGQTGDVRLSVADELRLLVTHGTLHLCGWDHAEPDDETAMRTMERTLLG